MLFYLLSALGLVPTFQKTKCKRLLHITMERIKVLEKRRQARVRQLHKDVTELWQLKKEHKVDPLLLRIWKELCLFSVYVKIAEYCEFVQVNLKDIAGQRECPRGLEEPLAGLCFAASCCADLPELQELREIFAMKYGKQIVSSGQDLNPNGHVNQQFLDCLYAKDPSETRMQALLDEIITKTNITQDMQQQESCDSVSTDGYVDANEFKQQAEGINCTVEESEVKEQSESEELQKVDVVQEPNHIETVSNEDMGSMELANEVANRKRTLENGEVHCKRALRRLRFGLNKTMKTNEIGGKKRGQTADKAIDYGPEVCSTIVRRSKDEAPNGVHYVEQPPWSQPPQRPPPPPPAPPPRRTPPPPPSLQNPHNIQQVKANTRLPLRCSTLANNYYLESFGSHVHPRLPKYEDMVAFYRTKTLPSGTPSSLA